MSSESPAARHMMPPIEAIRRLATADGYREAYRPGPWTECLVSREAERWIGRGFTEDAAFENALRQMLPSALARSLASRAVQLVNEGPLRARPRAETPVPPAAPKPEASVAVPEPTSQQTVASEASEVTEAPASAVPVAPRPAQPATTMVLVGPAALPERRELAAASAPREVVESLQQLAARIEAELPRFARQSAERQRLMLLVWISEAREAEEQLYDSREVAPLAKRVAHRLGELAKMFWPGTVRALQHGMRPEDTLELRTAGSLPPRSWREGSNRARGKLADHLMSAASAGLDDDGWADAAAREPAAPDPDALLSGAASALTRHIGAGSDAELADLDIPELLQIARTLRWVRGSVRDHVAWGLTVGRLRRVLAALGGRGAPVREALDPRFRPVAWATLVAGRVAEAPGGTSAKNELIAALPEASRVPEGLLAWLIRAIEAFSSPELSEVLAPLRDHVLAIGEAGNAHEDRRVRRRFRDLVERLGAPGSGPSVAPKSEPVADEEEETLAALERAPEVDRLVALVRSTTAGKRVLFVSNRHDAELEAKLTELLGVKITECDGAIRRVQAQCARIAKGSYDMVLSATGFQLHGVDGALARTAGAAGIPYVRVNRGRPLACLQAIARELGLRGEAGDAGQAAAAG